MTRGRHLGWSLLAASCLSLAGCAGAGGEGDGPSPHDAATSDAASTGATTGTGTGMSTGATGAGGHGTTGAGTTTAGTTTGAGGQAAGSLDALLQQLRDDRDGTLLEVSGTLGWPAAVEGGLLFVSTDPALTSVAGDHDAWVGTPMHVDQGFSWIVLEPPSDEHYKFTDGGATFTADPWARQLTYDDYGEMSLVKATGARLERYQAIGDAAMEPRTVRVWVPAEPITHELYVHDGQNLFDPAAIWGGWHLQDSAPAGMLVIGIDNTEARMDEYTPSVDDIDGESMGGKADQYADFIENTVRPLVRAHYGEPGPVGTLGSSLGGLVALLIAERYPSEYVFAGCMSGTLGWGSIGPGVHQATAMSVYASTPKYGFTVYVDSGGGGDTCADADGDGVDDDNLTSSDNYCETLQMKGTLLGLGYTEGTDLFSWYEPGATHDEVSWGARVFRPLDLFDQL